MKKAWISVLSVAALALAAGAQSPDQRKMQSGQEQSKPATSSKQSQQQSGSQSTASVSASASTSASASAGQNSASLSSGTTVNADLATTLDARKCHPGQRVVAKTTHDVKQDGQVVLHKGTRLIGHVTEAEAKTKANAESSLGIVFDEAVMKDGQSVPFHAAIQALAEAQSMAAVGDDGLMSSGDAMGSAGAMGSGGSRGGLIGGPGSAVGSTAGMAGGAAGGLDQTAGGALRSTSSVAGSAAGATGGLNAAGQLTSTSSGVFGMRGLNLNSAASNATEGSVVTSKGGSVHLSSGTQMLLRVTGQ
ncbi:MAG TPA: hypothetical protein VGR72_05105 [Candidatus Acidoferrales bacterium]|nr:hypothetical protein [Candidatus Acidoferrales bacterium]